MMRQTGRFLLLSLHAGAIFTPNSREQQTAYEYTMYEHNRGDSRFKVNSSTGVVLNDDPFNMTREGECVEILTAKIII